MKDLSLRNQTVIRPGDGVLACDLAGGAALLHTGSSTYFALNGVGAAVWSLIERSTTVNTLVDHITATFEVTSATARQDLEGLVASLAQHGLVRIEQG